MINENGFDQNGMRRTTRTELAKKAAWSGRTRLPSRRNMYTGEWRTVLGPILYFFDENGCDIGYAIDGFDHANENETPRVWAQEFLDKMEVISRFTHENLSPVL